MNENQFLDVEIGISAPGADEASRDILKAAEAAKALAISEEMAAQAAEEAAGHLDRYRRRLEGLRAQRERYIRVQEESGKVGKADSDAIKMIDRQINDMEQSIKTMSARREEALGIVNRQIASATKESAANAAGVASLNAQTVAREEAAASAADLLAAEQKRAREASIAAGAEVRKAEALLKATQMLDAIEAARARNQADRAAAMAAQDEAAIALAIEQGQALEKAWKLGLQGLQPYERAALRLEELQRGTVAGAEAEEVRLNALTNAARQLDDQARRAEANRGRSMSMLIDETQEAIARASRLTAEAFAKLQQQSDETLENVKERASQVKPSTEAAMGWNAIVDAVEGVPGPIGATARAVSSATDAQREAIKTAKEEVKALEALIGKMRDHESAIKSEQEALKADISVFERMTDRTEDQEAALAGLRKAHADNESRLGAIGKATKEAASAQAAANAVLQRGAASVGALVGLYTALFTALVAIGGVLLKAGLDTANLAIATEQAGKRAGVTATEMSRYAVVLKSLSVGGVTVEMQDLAEMMTEVSSKLSDAADAASPVAKAMGAIGLTVADLQGQSPAKVFDSIVDALSRVKDPATQTAQAMALLGDDLALKVLPIVRQGPGAIDAMKKSAEDLGLTLSGETLQSALEYRDAVAAIELVWDGFTRAIGEAVVPLLASLAERLRGAAVTVKVLYIAMTEGVEAANKYGIAAEALYEQQKKMRVAATENVEAQKAVAKAYTDAVNDTQKKADEAAAKESARQEKAQREAQQAAEKARQRAKAYDEAQRSYQRLIQGESDELSITRRAEDQIRALNDQRKEGLVNARQFAAARVVIEARAQQEIADLRMKAADAERADQADAIARLEAFGRTQLDTVTQGLADIESAQQEATKAAQAALADAYLSGLDARRQYEEAITQITADADAKRAALRQSAADEAVKALGEVWAAGMPEVDKTLAESSRREQETLAKLMAVHAQAYAAIDATAEGSAEERARLNAEFDRAQTEVVKRGTEERARIEEQALLTLAQTINGYAQSGLDSISKLVDAGLKAAQDGAQKTADYVAAAQERLSKATTKAEKEQAAERLASLRSRQEAERKNVRFLWRAQQALQAIQAGMATALAVVQSLAAPGGAANPLNVAAAIAAGVAGAASIGTILAAQEPKFHKGGYVDVQAAQKRLAPDESYALLRRGEFVVNPQGVASAGREQLQALNAGGNLTASLNAPIHIGPREAAAITGYAQGRWSSKR